MIGARVVIIEIDCGRYDCAACGRPHWHWEPEYRWHEHRAAGHATWTTRRGWVVGRDGRATPIPNAAIVALLDSAAPAETD